ncbi:MAG: type II toxin-antitoxin system RelE/ParE family toxin [Rhodospirillales bacterium]|nr:type II toxin-antitoxin system RelE/ParE family toxin [Rhodospirillales bacterium]
MRHRLSPGAEAQIRGIWNYTADQWGEAQADDYVKGLFLAFDALPANKPLWRIVPHESLRGAFFAKYQKHFIFFRELPSGRLGILAVLHEAQNIPRRLADIAGEDPI